MVTLITINFRTAIKLENALCPMQQHTDTHNLLPNLFTIEKSSGLGLAPLGNSTISRDISLQEASVLRQERRLRAASCLEMGPHDEPEGSTNEGLRMVPAGSVPSDK